MWMDRFLGERCEWERKGRVKRNVGYKKRADLIQGLCFTWKEE